MPQSPQEQLDNLIVQHGGVGGRLARALDLMSDAEIAAGQLTVYCRHGLDARKTHPDLEHLQHSLREARILLREAMRQQQGAVSLERDNLLRSDWDI